MAMQQTQAQALGHAPAAHTVLPQPQTAAQGADGSQDGPPFKLYAAGVPKSMTAEDLQPTFDPVRCAPPMLCLPTIDPTGPATITDRDLKSSAQAVHDAISHAPPVQRACNVQCLHACPQCYPGDTADFK